MSANYREKERTQVTLGAYRGGKSSLSDGGGTP
jgi:hypothetical protein